jgi:hypothetical protein
MDLFLSSLHDSVIAITSVGLWVQVLFWIGVAVLFGWLTGAIRYIRNSRVGVVEKLWSAKGSVQSGLIALGGEAGYQPGVLRGGLYFMLPFQYRSSNRTSAASGARRSCPASTRSTPTPAASRWCRPPTSS